MTIAARIKQFLNQNRISYQTLNHERSDSLQTTIEQLGLSSKEVLKAVPITDGFTQILAVLPSDCEIDFVSIELELKYSFQRLLSDKVNKLFCDCEMGSIPPLGEPYHLNVILDESIKTLEKVYIESGSHSALLQMSVDDFRFLTASAPIFSFAYSKAKESGNQAVIKPDSKFHYISEAFPKLPLQAQKILHLAETMMSDNRVPALHLSSRSFKFTEFDNMALACATHQIFTPPKECGLRTSMFWTHALYAASLAEMIANQVQIPLELDPDLCYLLGFTHNFGVLLFGHLFEHEFRLLRKWSLLNPEAPIEQLEKRLLGMGQGFHVVGRGHTQLGAWLMEYWQMPKPCIVVAEHHHDCLYKGPHEKYVLLIQLTNHLLKTVGIETETVPGNMEEHLTSFNITLEAARTLLKTLMKRAPQAHVEEMALHFAS